MEPSARRSFHLGRYHCVEALAQGPLGETFRAKVYGVAGLEKQYALKQIDAALRVDPTVRARLVEAARRYATLEHERIARLTEIHDEGDLLYLVTDLARGIDLPRLAAHLRSRSEALPVEQAVLVAVDIAEALDVAQQKGVLHEGLTPQTIWVLGEGEVRVSDFAIAGALDRPGFGTDETLVSLLAYTAPERLAGAASTSASDAWSLGAITYELCTGAPLLRGATVAELTASRAQGLAWERLPARPGLRELLVRLCADDPGARPRSAALLRESLAGLLGLEIGRARSGLTALARRALGRALTRTGSFAAVALPSQSLPTLAHEPSSFVATPASTPPPIRTGPRTLLGVPVSQGNPPPEAQRTSSWSPPRKPMPATTPITQPGMGVVKAVADPPQMERAELPPTTEHTDVGVTMTDASAELSFDEGVTSPHPRTDHEEIGESVEDQALELILTDELATSEMPTEPTSLQSLGGATERMPASLPASPSGRMRALPPPTPSDPSNDSGPMITIEHDDEAAADTTTHETVLPVEATPAVEAAPPAAAAPPVETAVVPGLPPQRAGSGGWTSAALVGVAVAVGVVLWLRRVPPPEPGPRTTTLSAEPHAAPVVAPVPASVADLAVAPVEVKPVEEAKPVEVKPVEVKKPVEEAKPVEPVVAAAAGQLVVHTSQPGAAVWIDGAARGPSPLSLALPEGKHRVSIVLKGWKLVSREVTVAASGTTIDEKLEPAKLPPVTGDQGGLKMRCHTLDELRILVDGVDTGLSCPNDERITVSAGEHEIGLQSPRTGEIHKVTGTVNNDTDHSTRIYTHF